LTVALVDMFFFVRNLTSLYIDKRFLTQNTDLECMRAMREYLYRKTYRLLFSISSPNVLTVCE
jgi:hypothetical protein